MLLESKPIRYLLISFISLALILFASYIYFIQYKKLDLEAIIVRFAESKIHGKLILTKFRWSIVQSRIRLSAEHLSILDEQNQAFLEADKPVAVLRWQSIFSFNPLKQYHLLASDHAKLYLDRDRAGIWNYQKIFPSKKPGFLQIEEAQFPRLDIEIRDAAYPDRKISYSEMKVLWAKQGFKRVYSVDVDSGKTSLNNHARLRGSIATGSLKHILRQRFDLDFDIKDLTPDDFAPILHMAGFDPEQISLISRLGKLSLKGKWGYFGSKLLNINSELTLQKNNLIFRTKIYGDFKPSRGETIMNWHIDTDSFRLAAWLETYAEALALYKGEQSNRFLKIGPQTTEQYVRAAKLIASKLNIIHPLEQVSLDLNVKSTVDKPEYKAEMAFLDAKGSPVYYPSTTEIKKIIAEFSSYNATTTIHKLIIPLNYASLVLSGWVTKDLAFDLKIDSKGVTLTQLKALILDLPYATVYQDMIRKLELTGLAALSLKMSRTAPDQEIKVKGEAQLAKVNIFHPDYPINVDNVFATMKLKEDQWELSKMTAYLAGDYFEAAGTLGLDPDPRKSKIALRLAFPKLDLEKIVQSRLLSLFALDTYVQKASGTVSNLLLEIKDVPSQSSTDKRFYKLLGNLELDDICLNDFNKVNGILSFMADSIRINNLIFSLGEASCSINGKFRQETDSHGKPIWIPDLDLKTSNLDISKAKSIVDGVLQFNTEAAQGSQLSSFKVFDGIVNSNLHIDEAGAMGKLNFTKLNFQYDPLKTPFREASGNVSINPERTLVIESLTGLYGSSDFKANGKIKNLFPTNTQKLLEYQLSVNGNFFMPDISPLFPAVINRYCILKGRMPMSFNLDGSRNKSVVDIKATLSDLEKFSYFNWLELDPSYKTVLKSRFLVTPQLIVSEDSELLVSKAASVVPITTYFNIKDYKNPQALTYYTKFSSPVPEPHLGYIAAHILTLRPFDIRYGLGNFQCQTHGSVVTQQTNCEFKFEDASIYKFGIGDLNAKTIDVKLFSVSNEDLETKIRASVGDWNTVPFTKLNIEMSSNGRSLVCPSLKANIGQGSSQVKFTLNYADLSSDFDISGQSLPAHDVAQGLWALGAEVPEGLVDIHFSGKTQGIEQEEMFYNLVATADVMVKNGKLSQLKSMQRLLSAINGFMSFDLNNVAQSLINYQGGAFDYMISTINYNKGRMTSPKLLLKAPQMEMILEGEADYNSDFIHVKGLGLIPKHEKSLLDKVGIGPVSIGNVLSLFKSGDKSKRYFAFDMQGPISKPEITNKSIQDSFHWLEEIP